MAKLVEGEVPGHTGLGTRCCRLLTFDSPLPAYGNIDRLLRSIWHQTHTYEPTTDWAIRYRAEGNRPLFLGDVVVIGEQAFACIACSLIDRPSDTFPSWKPVHIEAGQVVRRPRFNPGGVLPDE